MRAGDPSGAFPRSAFRSGRSSRRERRRRKGVDNHQGGSAPSEATQGQGDARTGASRRVVTGRVKWPINSALRRRLHVGAYCAALVSRSAVVRPWAWGWHPRRLQPTPRCPKRRRYTKTRPRVRPAAMFAPNGSRRRAARSWAARSVRRVGASSTSPNTEAMPWDWGRSRSI